MLLQNLRQKEVEKNLYLNETTLIKCYQIQRRS